jgi:hypothetical protein
VVAAARRPSRAEGCAPVTRHDAPIGDSEQRGLQQHPASAVGIQALERLQQQLRDIEVPFAQSSIEGQSHDLGKRGWVRHSTAPSGHISD